MMSDYTLVIDQSTSATKVMLFDVETSTLQFSGSLPHSQHFPKAGWVEHDPNEILKNTYSLVRNLCEEHHIIPKSVAITNQRETVVVWNKNTGEPVYNAIVWQCSRGTEICNKLIDDGKSEIVRKKTGLLINPYFSASGIQWILENVPNAKEEALKGNLLFGTTDAWLIWNFTNKKIHATDHTNASRTLLFNINTLEWDQDLFDLFHIPISMAPTVKYSDDVYGKTDLGFLPKDIEIAGVMGDSHGALAGQMCFKSGMGKATYGTGSSVMIHIGDKPLSPPTGLVCSVAFSNSGNCHFAFEGNIHYTGATIQWLIEELELIQSAQETEALAISVQSTDGVYFVPAFSGLGAPWWDSEARAMIYGMNRGTRKAHIVRAALESIAFQVRDLIDLVKNSGIKLEELRVDGGPVKNKFLMQFQSDQLQSVINRSPVNEASAFGAYLMNRLALKVSDSLADLTKIRTSNNYIKPQMSSTESDKLYEGWTKAIERTRYKS